MTTKTESMSRKLGLLAHATVHNGLEPERRPYVEIERELDDESGAWDENDPRVTITIRGIWDYPQAERIENLRASELDGLAKGLSNAIKYGRALKIIPPPLGEEEIERLWLERVSAEQKATS